MRMRANAYTLAPRINVCIILCRRCPTLFAGAMDVTCLGGIGGECWGGKESRMVSSSNVSTFVTTFIAVHLHTSFVTLHLHTSFVTVHFHTSFVTRSTTLTLFVTVHLHTSLSYPASTRIYEGNDVTKCSEVEF